jgi:hypothetical protein
VRHSTALLSWTVLVAQTQDCTLIHPCGTKVGNLGVHTLQRQLVDAAMSCNLLRQVALVLHFFQGKSGVRASFKGVIQ